MSDTVSPLPTDHPRPTLPDAAPPEDYRTLAAEYPWLSVAAGAGIGLLVGALLPRGAGRGLGKRAFGLALAAGEVSLALSARARDRAGQGASSARGIGLDLARRALTAAAKARK